MAFHWPYNDRVDSAQRSAQSARHARESTLGCSASIKSHCRPNTAASREDDLPIALSKAPPLLPSMEGRCSMLLFYTYLGSRIYGVSRVSYHLTCHLPCNYPVVCIGVPFKPHAWPSQPTTAKSVLSGPALCMLDISNDIYTETSNYRQA